MYKRAFDTLHGVYSPELRAHYRPVPGAGARSGAWGSVSGAGAWARGARSGGTLVTPRPFFSVRYHYEKRKLVSLIQIIYLDCQIKWIFIKKSLFFIENQRFS